MKKVKVAILILLSCHTSILFWMGFIVGLPPEHRILYLVSATAVSVLIPPFALIGIFTVLSDKSE